MWDLTDRRALVCGSTQGIGRAAAGMLARAGAGVTLMARNEQALAATAAELAAQAGAPLDYVVADFGEPESVRRGVEEGLSRHGTYHILINNTGGPMGGTIFDAPAEQFERAFRMHVVCNHLLAQAVVPGMRAAGYGRIVNIASTSVREPIPGLGVSNTIRAAVAGWAKTLSKELAPSGITVNNVLPGYTSTVRLDALMRARAERRGVPVETIAQELRASVPMGRFATADEIAAAVLFLVSPAAAYITGVSLPVDGGRLSSI